MIFAKNRPILVVSSLIAALTLSSCGEQTTGMTLVAGQERIHTDGARNVAKFALPHGIAINNNDVMFVVDTASHTVRRINKNGAVTTLAGAAYQAGAADGVGVEASFHHPVAIAFDKKRNRLYVVDAGNNTIRMVRMNGTVTTLAGSAGLAGYADGKGNQAAFSFSNLIAEGDNYPTIALDPSGNIFVTDAAGLRKITPRGVVSTYFSYSPQYTDPVTQTVYQTQSSYQNPIGTDLKESSFVIDSKNNFWFSIPNALQQVGSTGLLGTRLDGFLSDSKLAINASDEIYSFFGDQTESYLTKVDTTTNQVTPVWQQGAIKPEMAFEDAARLAAIAVDSTGNVYGADPINAIVRRYTPNGTASVFSGTTPLIGARNGAALKASFALPSRITSDLNGNIYVAGTIPTIRRINASNNNVITLAGKTAIDGWFSQDGRRENAGFKQINGMVFNPLTNQVYILDQQSGATSTPDSTLLRKMTTGGNVSTVTLSSPLGAYTQGLTTTSNGLMFVVDNTEIKRITTTGSVSSIAGQPSTTTYADGNSNQASFVSPQGLATDPQSNLYTLDSGALRKITSQGVVTTLTGAYNQYARQDGSFAAARFGQYSAVVGADQTGLVYVRDCNVGDIQIKLIELTPNQSCILRKVDTVNQTVSTTNVSIPNSAGLIDIHFAANGDAYSTFEHGVFRLNLN